MEDHGEVLERLYDAIGVSAYRVLKEGMSIVDENWQASWMNDSGDTRVTSIA